jgi:hypothetical protein
MGNGGARSRQIDQYFFTARLRKLQATDQFFAGFSGT